MPLSPIGVRNSSARTGAAAMQVNVVPIDATVRERLANYVALSKPRISLLVLVSVGVGFTLAARERMSLGLLAAALLGIGLSAAASSILNQWYERESDALMPRTADRPLPSGRVSAGEALWLGTLLAIASAVWLVLTVNLTTAALTLATCALYVCAYTPLKSRSVLCTTVGAIPGAMPLVLGWTAGGGELSSPALALFAILYVWQFPHFLAIAWIYQDQYRRAGLRMLPGDGQRPLLVGLTAAAYALVLIPVSLWARRLGLAGDAYALSALVLGGWYLSASVRFAAEPGPSSARKLLWTSLAYLPMLLAALTIDHVRLLW